ncbi:MAG: DUF3089 domain-containing protein [Acidimicrobiia bacterium]
MRVRKRVLALCCCTVLLAAACDDDGDDGNAGRSERDRDREVAYAGYESAVYADAANWLCRPDIDDDYCDEDLDATVVEANGDVEVEEFEPATDPPIDCFYVYPTVSLDPGTNSDLVADPETEGLVVRNQAARLASECRVFAPIYEQFTLTALLERLGGDSQPAAPEGQDPRATAYESALDAWKHYMANDNDGRGVVLVGHSQGSGVLTRLIQEEIDGNEQLRGQLVSAILAGTSLAVPPGEDGGGDFQNIPLCRATDEVGCAISYASFRSTAPPPPDATFGRTDTGPAACTNPAALGGGAATAEPYFETDPQRGAFFEAIGLAGGESPSWVDPASGTEIETPWVTLPDFVEAECVERDGFSYLEITVNGDPADPRIDDIGGDTALASFGLHIVDVNIVLGNIVDVVGRQAETYSKS